MAKEEPMPLGDEVSVSSFAAKLASAAEDSVIVICGAGISVSAGIPDFRSKGSGLYDNLQKYNLPRPEAVFTLEFFKEDPLPFFHLAREIYPGKYAPTAAHAFLRLLQEKRVLRRCYTQNIDTLERMAGVEAERVVEAHGSFSQAHCIGCRQTHSSEWLKQEIFAQRLPVLCPRCGDGLVKPDIVFFGEELPGRFSDLSAVDFPKAEFLIVMGTSLSVEPLASVIHEVPASCPRLLLNNSQVGLRDRPGAALGFRFDAYDNCRDVALLTTCDEGVKALAEAVGWGADFEDILLAQRLEHRQALLSAQLKAMKRGNSGLAAAQPMGIGDDAICRSWRRRFRPEMPQLALLEPEDEVPNDDAKEDRLSSLLSEMSSKADSLFGDSRLVRAVGAGSTVSEVQGGSVLVLRVLLSRASVASSQGELWLGLVPSGSSRPDRVLDRCAIVAANCGPRGADVSLTVPALRKKQLEAGTTKSYEVWLVRCAVSTNDEDIALARVGPVAVSQNSDSVAAGAKMLGMAFRLTATHGDGLRVGAEAEERASRAEPAGVHAEGDAAGQPAE